MTKKQFEGLVKVFESHYKYYKGWAFAFEYPGIFAYHQMGGPLTVYFTPDFDGPGVIPIQVSTEDDQLVDSKDVRYAHPENMSQDLYADQLFRIIRPFLEKFDTW
jgi:hypothetical protein